MLRQKGTVALYSPIEDVDHSCSAADDDSDSTCPLFGSSAYLDPRRPPVVLSCSCE